MTGFDAVEEAFRARAESDPSHSAQLAIYHRGELVLDLVCGSGMQADSLLPIYSSTKGATAIAIALLVQRGALDLDARVATYWPEFAANGKDKIAVKQLLSHQAGLVGVDGGFTFDDVYEHHSLARRLAAQRPYWEPGTAFRYHGLTIGVLADELVRRIDGRSVVEVVTNEITRPRRIDVWMPTPAEEDHRVVSVEFNEGFLEQAATSPAADTLSASAMPLEGRVALLTQVNEAEFRRAGIPAGGGLATARGLAKLYAAIRHEVGGPAILGDDTIAAMSQAQITGIALGTESPSSFGVIFQRPVSPHRDWGSPEAFGHDGGGGSLGFCDPTHDLAFGYLVQRVPQRPGLDPHAIALSKLARTCALT